ncbi:MAG: ribosome silencing factor [Bacillota bacterium]|nr:ribosome silencing factor [Bacillota bacterium]
MTGKPKLGSRELALYAAQLVAEKKAHDVQLLEVGQVSIIADYFLLATGTSSIQVHSLVDHLIENLKKEGYYALHIEGSRESWWVVLDYGSLMIHLFQPEAREFYNLERLWCEAPQVDIGNQAGSPLRSGD